MPPVFATLTSLLYLCATLTVFVTAHTDGFEHALKQMTQESGFFEWVSVLLLLGMAITALRALASRSPALQGWK